MSKQLATLTLTEGPRPIPGSPLVRGATLGRYVVLDLLGSGGMGVVYAAYDFGLDRRVCLKLVRDGGGEKSAERQERLLREARSAARVSHPNVVTVHDVGTWEDHVFVAMELVEGGTLRRWLRAQERTLPEILEVFTQAGRGLAAAHSAGLVHRDFKPDNVLVGLDGRVRVTDFGLARDADAGQADGGHTSGTPAYMAPEQHRGEAATAATDQFSFALSLYEALHGASPYGEASGESLRAAKVLGRMAPAPTFGRVPGWLRSALLKALAPDRTQRHDSMEALLAALRPPRRHRAVAMIGAATTVATFGVALVVSGSRGTPVLEASRPAPVQVLADAADGERCAQPPALHGSERVVHALEPAPAPPRAQTLAGAPRPASTFERALPRPAPAAPSPSIVVAAAERWTPPAGRSRRAPPSFTVHTGREDSAEDPERSEWIGLIERLEQALTELGIIDPPAQPELQLMASLGVNAREGQTRAEYLLGQYGQLATQSPEQVHHPIVFTPRPPETHEAEVSRLEAELASAADPVEQAKLQFALARLLYSTDNTRALQLARTAQQTLRREDLASARTLLSDLESWLDDHGTRIIRSHGL